MTLSFPKILRAFALLLGLGLALGMAPLALAQKPLVIGVSAGPLEDILGHAAGLAARQGIEVKLVKITDWVTPNEALRAGDLDANLFQNAAYLATQRAARGYDFALVSRGILLPGGLYSRKFRSVQDIPEGATVAIASDPLNTARALLLLQRAGLLTLRNGGTLGSGLADIAANPKKLKLVQAEGPQLARLLDDVALAAIGLTVAIPAGIDPKSALLLEDFTQQELALTLVSRADNQNDPQLRKFAQIFNSPEVKAYASGKYPAFVPTW